MSDRDSTPQNLLEEAMAHHRAGRVAEADSAYRRVLEADPLQFDALRFLGLLAHQKGAQEEAASLLERAIAVNPEAPETLNQLGAVHHARNNGEAARSCFERALTLRPDYYEARMNLACLLGMQCEFARAQAEFEALLVFHADRPEIFANLGVVLQEQGKFRPAIDSYRKALSLKPDLREARLNLAQALETLGDVPSAIEQLQAALQLDPDNASVQVTLGRLLHTEGRHGEARECFKKAIALRPDQVEARWCSTMCEIPLAYGAGEDPEDSRRAFEHSLDDLHRWFDDVPTADGSVAVGIMQPYYLAYQESDNRPLLSRYGDLCAKLMQRSIVTNKVVSLGTRRPGKVRVGIVSGKIYDQSVWTAIVKGWCRHLNQERFELHLLYTGKVRDRETDLARSLVPEFVTGLKDLRQWTQQIVDGRFDVLLYPEIGMDATCVRLASLRLAPVQVASWGHPETTGLPTIDYYLSAEDFEPPGSQAWYREKLVPLPGLGCIYEPHRVAFDASPVNNLALNRSGVLALCPGTPYKYLPRHDAIFIEIARRMPDCRFVFCHDTQPNVSAIVQSRLRAAFTAAGLASEEHVIFVPHQSRAGFFGLMQIADLCLDTIGFSGFNTAMQAAECGLPVVGYEGRFMRGRFASGILRRMGLSELVATTDKRYVELAVKLATDVAYLQRVRARIAEGALSLFGDRSPLPALEDFLERAAIEARIQ